ncbi:MAG: ABC transporter permease [Gemmatimonadaceae bacterium]
MLVHDLRLAARAVRRNPGFALTVALTLALGVGANTAMFSVADASLLRPPPFADASRIVMLYRTQAGDDRVVHRTRWSYPRFSLLRAKLSMVEHTAAFNRGTVNLGGDEAPERVEGESVSPEYFAALRVPPVAGRTFLPEEDSTALAHPVIVLGHALWMRRFGRDPSVVGRTLRASGVPLTIVGVMPAGFSGLTGRAEYWVPHSMAPALHYRDHLTSEQNFISVIGRLKSGVSRERAEAELGVAIAAVNAELPSPSTREWTRSATLMPLDEARRDPGRRNATLVLFGAVGLVLLIACVNLANLFLVRGVSRARETAIRLALGASRGRLVRQLVTESAVLALLGGALGVALAVPGTQLLVSTLAPRMASGANDWGALSEFLDVRIDNRALGFALAVSLATGILVGLFPALRDTGARSASLTGALKSGTRAWTRGPRLSAQGLLVVSQIALALVLLVGAGLLLESFARLRGVAPGFDPEHVITFWINPGEARYTTSDAPALIAGVLERVRAVPGVEAATVSRCTPYMTTCANTGLYIDGRDNGAPGTQPSVGRHYVGADHFRTLRVPVLRGRTFTERDRAGAPGVAIINQTAARTYWPGEDPIGRRIWFSGSSGFGSRDSAATIVGVVGDVRYWPLDEPIAPDIYTPYAQFTYPSTIVMVRSIVAPTLLVPALRAAVRAADHDLPIYDVQTLSARAGSATADARFNAIALAGFALLALVLAAVGIYGVMAHSIAQRTRELGLRLALGATRGNLVAMVGREGMRLSLGGIVAGIVAALALTRLLRSLLFGVSATDPFVFAAIAGLVATIALVASLLPARAATRISPMTALKSD